ncbi:MAG TPA: carboxypeptidase-like regulatory domain-containing protein, partial [Solirubrobacterales bacterium]|nr:carboxypeptidase-like regulatory domain-containing protein [Solirubrobacterales bacterium]
MPSGAQKILAVVALLSTLGWGGRATAEERRAPGVAGLVHAEASPIATAGVYAYQLSNFSLHKVTTDAQGRFLFQDLPAGLYKIIAHKAGFEPVVILLTRTTAQAYQFVNLELSQSTPKEPAGPAPEGEDVWSLRARIPADVLRDIELAGAETVQLAEQRLPAPSANGLLSQFHTEMQAMTGVDGIAAASESQVSGAQLGIQGRLGQMQVGLRGHFWQFEPSSLQAGSAGTGKTSAVSLDLESSPGSKLVVTSLSNRLGARQQGQGFDSPIDFEHYRVSWSQPIGNGQSDFAAQYTSESNFNRAGANDPAAIPGESRTWRVEGAYTTSFSPRTTLQAGMRYRAQQFGVSGTGDAAVQALGNLPGAGNGNLDLFGRGSFRLQPAFLVEYGLYSTLADGSVEMTPRGGVVLRLGDDWQLETSASRRAYSTTSPLAPVFLPTLYKEADLCEEGSR